MPDGIGGLLLLSALAIYYLRFTIHATYYILGCYIMLTSLLVVSFSCKKTLVPSLSPHIYPICTSLSIKKIDLFLITYSHVQQRQ